MHGGSEASCCARWPSSGQPAGCRGIGLRNTRGPYAVSCRDGSGSAPPLRTYIPRARDGSCSISSMAVHELTTSPWPGGDDEGLLNLEPVGGSLRHGLFLVERLEGIAGRAARTARSAPVIGRHLSPQKSFYAARATPSIVTVSGRADSPGGTTEQTPESRAPIRGLPPDSLGRLRLTRSPDRPVRGAPAGLSGRASWRS